MPDHPPRLLLWVLALACAGGLRANNAIQITVDPGAGRLPISPYIYGTNSDLPGVANPGSRRYGGNRLTGYNWETNASNAGTDWYNESDNNLVSGLPASEQNVPAIALTQFQDESLADGTPYTILTLQMAGYVAADENGDVTADQAAPSFRWDQVIDDTPGGVFNGTPDLTDHTVYMDELLNLLIGKYGPASGPTGVKGYDLDNEPDLWNSTHPYLHPAQTTCAELISKSVALAKTVKRMDPAAEVLGPVSYGSNGYFTFQNATDWAGIQTANPGYRWFLDYYLDQMSQASAQAGERLLDVFDLHRYSDDAGGSPSESITGQTDYATNLGCDEERVQSPRVLWDPTFVENSWVQEWDSQFLPYLPNLKASIAKYYPGTKLGFSEYGYGGESDISGGLAEADVLGIYGKYGVYIADIWVLHSSPPPLYVSAAFNLYLNYDGAGGKFGSTSVQETDSDTVDSSAYASIDMSNEVHLVALNKSFTTPADFTVKIAGSVAYTRVQVYAFDSTGSAITLRAPAAIAANQFTYTLPPLTAAHFVASSPPTGYLTNLSARAYVSPGLGPNAVFTAGFVTAGADSKSILARGVGPALANFNIANYLPDPSLTINVG
ncbi:MAG: glycoside hydrolase family 44 protein, partial [Opitutaceae bacterium]